MLKQMQPTGVQSWEKGEGEQCHIPEDCALTAHLISTTMRPSLLQVGAGPTAFNCFHSDDSVQLSSSLTGA